MFQEQLHLHLHDELVLQFVGLDDCFLNSFYCYQKAAYFVNSQRHWSESAFAQMFYDYKILKLWRLYTLLIFLLENQKLRRTFTWTCGAAKFCRNFIWILMFIGLRGCIEKTILLDKSVGWICLLWLFGSFRSSHLLILWIYRSDEFLWTPRFISRLKPFGLGFFFNLLKIFHRLKLCLAPCCICWWIVRLETFADPAVVIVECCIIYHFVFFFVWSGFKILVSFSQQVR